LGAKMIAYIKRRTIYIGSKKKKRNNKSLEDVEEKIIINKPEANIISA
jgi:hypothetical protein